MTDRAIPTSGHRERDLRNIAKTLRDAASPALKARHPDALRDLARRIDDWADAHLAQSNSRLTLYRDTWNLGAGGGGEGNGYSYRPDPTKNSRVYVPRFLCGKRARAPRTIVIEGLPPYDAANDRPRLLPGKPERRAGTDAGRTARPRLIPRRS